MIFFKKKNKRIQLRELNKKNFARNLEVSQEKED